MHATNAAVFKKTVYELTGVKPQLYIMLKNKQDDLAKKHELQNKPSGKFSKVDLDFKQKVDNLITFTCVF